MGRRKKTPLVEDMANTPENTSAGAELGPEIANISENKLDLRNESRNATVDRVGLRVYSSRFSSRKTAATGCIPVRKSPRLQSVSLAAQMLEIERIAGEITTIEDDDNQDDDDKQPVDNSEAIFKGKNLEEKVENLLRFCKEHQENIDALKPEMATETPDHTSGAGAVTYKSLYINSQKKIEALTEESHQLKKKIEDFEEENRQLNNKLEHAHGKIEVYEQGNFVPSNILEKWNAVFFCQSSTKDAETGCNAISEAIRGSLTTSNIDLEGVLCAKRKKSAKETKN